MISGFAMLGDDGKIPTGQLPAIAITDTFEAGSQAAMLALAAQKGDIAIRSDLNKCFVLAGDDPAALVDWKELLSPTVNVISVAGLTGAIGASTLKAALAIAAGDVSGLAASATIDTTNAGNITAGTLGNSRLSGVALTANNLSDLASVVTTRSNLGLGTLATLNVGGGLTNSGGNLSANVTSVAGRTGAVTLSNADISGLGYFATGTDASNLTGTFAATRLPAFTGGDVTSTAGSASLAIGASKVTNAMLNADVFSTAHTWSAAQAISSASVNALAVGANGTTNPALQVDASTASSGTGIQIKSAAAAGGVALTALSSGTNENLTIAAKGTGSVTVAGAVFNSSSLTIPGFSFAFAPGGGIQSFSHNLYLRTDLANSIAIGIPTTSEIQFGGAPSGAGSSFTLGGQPGSGTNVIGGDLTVQAGAGTGNAAVPSLIFKSPVAVGSGSGAQAQTETLKLKGGNVYMTNLPTADPHVVGVLWKNSGVLTVSAG
jgi:hypothetical protein